MNQNKGNDGTQFGTRCREFKIWRVACLVVSVLLLAEVASADNVTVDCTGATPGAFTSINAAINSLDLVGPHTITVVSDCTENVSIFRRDRLTITAPIGQMATITALNPNGPVLSINGSHNINIARLVLRGGGSGIQILVGSTVEIISSRVTENSGQGIQAAQGSFVAIGGGVADQSVEVSHNGGPGIASNGGELNVGGNITVESNGGAGISITSGGRAIINGGENGNVVRDNGLGININGTAVNLNGLNTIQNNGGVGVQVANGNANFGGGMGSDGVLRVTTIEGHVLGMNIASSGSVNFSGPHRIRNNGLQGAEGMFRGGIRVGTVSRIQFNGSEITGNIGVGVFADFNGALAINGATVTGNTEGGVRVSRLSAANFGPGNSVTGNGGSNVSCDTTALIFGELTGISNIDCKNIERPLGPPRPGAIKETSIP